MFHFYGVLNLYNLRDLQFRIIEHINDGAVVHLYHGSCQMLGVNHNNVSALPVTQKNPVVLICCGNSVEEC